MPLPEHLKFLHRGPEEPTRQYHDRLKNYHSQLNGEGVPELVEPVTSFKNRQEQLRTALVEAQEALRNLEQENSPFLKLNPTTAKSAEREIIVAVEQEQRQLKGKIAELQSQLEVVEPHVNLAEADTAIRGLAGDLVTPKDLHDPKFGERAEKIWQQVAREQQERRVVEDCQEAGESEANKLITFLRNNPKPKVAELKPYTTISFVYISSQTPLAFPNCLWNANQRFLLAFKTSYSELLENNKTLIPRSMGKSPFTVNLELKNGSDENSKVALWPKTTQEASPIAQDSPELAVLDLAPEERNVYEQAVERKISPGDFNRRLAQSRVDEGLLAELRNEAFLENQAVDSRLAIERQQKIAEVDAKISQLSMEIGVLKKQRNNLNSYIDACKEYNDRLTQYNHNESSLTTAEAELKNLNIQLTAELAKTKKVWLGFKTVSDANPQMVSRLQEEVRVKEGYVKTLKGERERLQRLLAQEGQKVNAVYNEQGRNVPLRPPFSRVDLEKLQSELDKLRSEHYIKDDENHKLGKVRFYWNSGRGVELNLEEAKFLFIDLYLVMEKLRRRFEELVDQYQAMESVNLIHCVLTLTPHDIEIQMGPAYNTKADFLTNTRSSDLFPSYEYASGYSNQIRMHLPLLKQVAQSEKLRVAMARDIGSIYRNRVVKHKQALRIDIVDNVPNS